ncbi:MAG: amidase [Spirochaetales bacterium]|nr:amidase [Spirochaetales bacterium]
MTATEGLARPLSLAKTAADVASGKRALEDHVLDILDRVDALEPSVLALLPEPGRRDRLLSDARRLLAAWPDPQRRPLLFGTMVGVKDIFAVDGFPTRAGSRLPPELFAMPEGPVVRALRGAGALILGKTVTTEFAYFSPGPTRNPRDPRHTPGGSSSGSAAAVAAGFCALATATQTIGSVTRPAAFCGVAGWKPSYERLSRKGVVPFSRSVDHVGLIAADAASLALAAAALAPHWSGRRSSPAAFGRRAPVLLVPNGPYLGQASADGMAAFQRDLDSLAAAGCVIERTDAFPDIEDINTRHRRICAADLAHAHRAWFDAHGDLYAPATRELIEQGRAVDPKQLAKDLAGRRSLRKRLDKTLAASGADAWVSPAAPGPAPAGLESTGSPIMNLPWTHAGVPTVNVPSATAWTALPTGIQLAGRFGRDEELVALAVKLELLLGR